MNVIISARIDGHVLFKWVSLRSVRSTPRCPTNELCTLLMVEYVSLDNLLGSATIDRVSEEGSISCIKLIHSPQSLYSCIAVRYSVESDTEHNRDNESLISLSDPLMYSFL